MPSNSCFLAYSSNALRAFSTQDLVDLLAVSRANNERDDVTGMLLYRGGNFLQALEGPEAAVRQTMRRIERDASHGSVSLLLEEPREERLFGEWSMAFEDVSKLDSSALPGLNSYLAVANDNGAKVDAAEHDVFEFFRVFRDHMR
jgi:hypothetical protein